MEKYFSKSAKINSTRENMYSIYIIDNENIVVDERIKELCKKSSLRSKRMLNGYYNLNHFGNEICLYHDFNERTFYVIGCIKDCCHVFWSYILKWILTEYVLESGVHLKGTLIERNNEGVLIIGGKSSGKSTLVNKILNMDKKTYFISNTHVVVKRGIALGVHSNINFRKEMAIDICSKIKKLNNTKITGCTNLDPIDLEYKLKGKCKIKYIIFYQYNNKGEYYCEPCSDKDMFTLLSMYSEALNIYSLRDDLINYYNGNVNKIKKILNNYNQNLIDVSKYTKNYIVTADACEEELIQKLLDNIQ